VSDVLAHVIDAITPASQAAAAAARSALRIKDAPALERLVGALAAAQHSATLRDRRRTLIVAAGDHGVGDPGIAMGADHPTAIAAHAVADPAGALATLLRNAGADLVLVDAGAREPAHMPSIAVALGRGPTRDLLHEPAQTIVDAALGLEAGIALVLSLNDRASASRFGTTAPRSGGAAPQADTAATAPRSGGAAPAADSARSGGAARGADAAGPPGDPEIVSGDGSPLPDILAVGAIGVGAEVASAALLGAVRGDIVALPERDDVAELAMQRGVEVRGASGLELLASFGGGETAVLAGVMLAAASMNIPVLLDSYATGAAALVAAALAPSVTGYLIAPHRGSFTMPAIIEQLGIPQIFDGGFGHGDGTGAGIGLVTLEQLASAALGR
jgi:nicotinate-nucleotide--dimethylbenzimidazole phosphoribosyltransferase